MMHIRNLFTTILFSCFSLIIMAQGGIEFFHGTWQEALEKSAEEDKLIFVDAYTTWCGPCKMMAAKVFTDEAVGEFFNKNFINMKMDMEDGESTVFRRTFSVSAYPTLFWINGDNEAVHKSVGAKKPEDLIATAQDAMKKNDRSGKYEEKYLEGNRDYDLVYNYVKALNQANKPSLKIANDFLDSNPDITEKEKQLFIYEACQEADSKLCKSLTAAAQSLKSEFGPEKWDEKIATISWKTVDKAIEFEYFELVKEAIDVMNEHHSDPAAFEYESQLMYYSVMKNTEEYSKLNKKYYNKFAKKDALLITTLLDQMKSRFADDKDLMKAGADYAKQLLKIEKNEQHYIRYAEMLVINENKDKAIQVCEEGLEWLTKNEIADTKLKAYLNYVQKL